MAGPVVYHRGPDFPALLTGVVEDLKRLFPTTHEVFVLSTSGTGAMEAAVVNTLSTGDTVIVARAGNFGARWDKICAAYGIQVVTVEAPWGRAIDPDKVAQALKTNPHTRAVLATHSETSTGVLHDIEAIANVVAATDALFIVDGVSSVCAHPLPTDEWGIDVAVTASQKGLMVPPGFAVIALGPKARKASTASTLPKHYLDLALYRQSLDEGRGPFTLPVTLLVGARGGPRYDFRGGHRKRLVAPCPTGRRITCCNHRPRPRPLRRAPLERAHSHRAAREGRWPRPDAPAA